MAPTVLAVTICVALLFVEYVGGSPLGAPVRPQSLSAALRHPPGNPQAGRKLLGWGGSIESSNAANRANTATLLAEDTTVQQIDNAADGTVDPYVAAKTGVVTSELATLASQQSGNYRGNGQRWVGHRKLADAAVIESSRKLLDYGADVGSGSGNGATATLWAEDTTAEAIDDAVSGDVSIHAAARTGVVTGQLATLASQGSGDQYWVGGRRLAAAAATGSGSSSEAATASL